jgi:hypothetical protein
MAWKLFAQEMVNEMLRLQDADPEFRARLKGLNFSFILLGTDAPVNEDRQVEIILKDGHFVSVGVNIKPAPSDLRNLTFDKTKFDAKIVGDHQTIFELISGEIDLFEAIKRVRIEGDFGKLITKASGFMGFIQYLSTCDIEP